jgi:hypothetical protein
LSRRFFGLCSPAPSFLAIPHPSVERKKYLAPTTLGKNAQKTRGYFPDFSVWEMALPIMIVEAKAPDVPVDVGYREACLYARHLNSRYKHGVNTSQRSATSSVLSA